MAPGQWALRTGGSDPEMAGRRHRSALQAGVEAIDDSLTGSDAGGLRAGMFEAQTGSVANGFQAPGNERRQGFVFGLPGVGEARRRFQFDYLTGDFPRLPFGSTLGEAETVSEPGLEGVGQEPLRQFPWIGQGQPDPFGRVRIEPLLGDGVRAPTCLLRLPLSSSLSSSSACEASYSAVRSR